jgi:hypothetical protein
MNRCKKRWFKSMHRERSRCEMRLLSSHAKSANVSIRIWCWFMIHHKKVHPSTCWKLVLGWGRPWPPSLFFPRLDCVSEFSPRWRKKSLRREKKVRKQVERNGSRPPSPRGLPDSPPIDFDQVDDQFFFREQMCERQ